MSVLWQFDIFFEILNPAANGNLASICELLVLQGREQRRQAMP
jgi:hypothetical protein